MLEILVAGWKCREEIIAFCSPKEKKKIRAILYLINKHSAHLTVHYAGREMERSELKSEMRRGL